MEQPLHLPLIVPQWNLPEGVKACVTTRAGGVSAPPFDSLNLGGHVGDAPKAVAENRQRVNDVLALPSHPVWLDQVHGTQVVNAADSLDSPTADASFSTERGAVCAVMTADCLPVLFCDAEGTCVAAAHAGWRGLHAGVLEKTVEAMVGQAGVTPSNIRAWLGPAIGPYAFEVGEEVREAFVSKLGTDQKVLACFQTSRVVDGQARYLADIYALAGISLSRVGVTDISGGGFCTHTDKDRFYSYRRDGVTGRMASLIWME